MYSTLDACLGSTSNEEVPPERVPKELNTFLVVFLHIANEKVIT